MLFAEQASMYPAAELQVLRSVDVCDRWSTKHMSRYGLVSTCYQYKRHLNIRHGSIS